MKPPKKPKEPISPNRFVLRMFLGIMILFTVWVVTWRATDEKYLREAEHACTTIHFNGIAPEEAVQYLTDRGFESRYDREQEFVMGMKKLPFWAGFGRQRADCHIKYQGETPFSSDASVHGTTSL